MPSAKGGREEETGQSNGLRETGREGLSSKQWAWEHHWGHSRKKMGVRERADLWQCLGATKYSTSEIQRIIKYTCTVLNMDLTLKKIT